MYEDKIKIGLETHIQLFTDTKLLCGCPTSGSTEPNTRVCPTCLGMPGSRPRINKKAIEMGIKIAKALNCEIPEITNFSRKTYFYPDMPKNFQTTQFSTPLGKDGELELELAGKKRKIRIKRIHIEEDPGSIKHSGGDIETAKYSLLDYNRSGIPLCEIVTRPDLKTPREARDFVKGLANILEHLKIYDAQSEATIRSDGNISMGSGRVEIKNITGYKNLEDALNFEMKRQKRMLSKGQEIKRETRSYNDKKGITTSLRQKEVEQEYGYIFEPDLTKIKIADSWIETVTKDFPELPHLKKERYINEMDMSPEMADTICSDVELTETFEEVKDSSDVSIAAKIISGPLKKVLNYNEVRLSETNINNTDLIEIIGMIKDNEVTERNAEMIIREMVKTGNKPKTIKKEKGLGKLSADTIKNDIKEVIDEEKEAVQDYKQGKTEALNYLIGKVMQKVKSRADARQVREKLIEELEE